MARSQKPPPVTAPSRKRSPATTPEARENQVIAMAYDLAEKQIEDGTASAQVISHFLKMGSTRERFEQERLRMEVTLLDKKREAMESAVRVEELYEGAINALRSYTGQGTLDKIDDDYDE